MSSQDSPLNSIENRIAELTLDELKDLQKTIAEFIQKKETGVAPYQKPGRQLLEHRHVGRVTYQLEKVRCGKPTCRCAQENGELHGPYWYLYRWNGKKVVSEYIGKKAPEEIRETL